MFKNDKNLNLLKPENFKFNLKFQPVSHLEIDFLKHKVGNEEREILASMDTWEDVGKFFENRKDDLKLVDAVEVNQIFVYWVPLHQIDDSLSLKFDVESKKREDLYPFEDE
ncbi:hypothetical protein MHBO_002455 [Bonamia ostreae]|uniref:Uncharacterized protein n=1 Tax=Bonamia ostreae TaxID=126728 RepID=A0ABV2AME8_9EUKA